VSPPGWMTAWPLLSVCDRGWLHHVARGSHDELAT
jgi:hypothetical protein